MTWDKASFARNVDAFIRELRSVVSPDATSASGDEEQLGDQLRTLTHAWNPQSPSGLDELVEGLCELALHADPRLSDFGQQLIFSAVVEHLADSFEPAKARLYDQLFARVIDRCRRHEAGRALDLLLSRFGLPDSSALLARKQRLADCRPLPIDARSPIRRVFIPSRVTLGADVAVTSIVLQKIERVFPQAECVVFGPNAVGELLEGTTKAVRFIDCPYHRRGGLMARLNSWVHLVQAIEAEMDTLEADACLVLDPDSRLTQLGLLPLVPSEVASFFFGSRAYRRHGAETLGELTGRWLDEIFGQDGGGDLHPKVVPAARQAASARTVARRARASGAGHVTAVTLGVGGNARKRIPGRFELDLVQALLSDGGVVILDKGVDEEVARVEAIVAVLASQGTRIVELQTNPLRLPDGASGQVLVHQGGLRSLLALVAASDLYVGYDSAFQHVAAALSIPVIDIFLNPPGELFSRRWRPYSKAPVSVVEVAETGPDADGRETLLRVLDVYREHRAAALDHTYQASSPS